MVSAPLSLGECLAHSTRRATCGHEVGRILLTGNQTCQPTAGQAGQPGRGGQSSLALPPYMISSQEGTEERPLRRDAARFTSTVSSSSCSSCAACASSSDFSAASVSASSAGASTGATG